MNKYIAFVALALTCLVAVSAKSIEVDEDVSSELSLNPSNDEEVASLEGKAVLFSDYCIRSRDYVVRDVKSNTNGLASKVFKLFFNSAEDIGREAVDVENKATDAYTKQLRNPEADVDFLKGDSEADKTIAYGQEVVKNNPFYPFALMQSFAYTLLATKNAVTSRVLSNLDAMKSEFGLSTITSSLRSACNQVDRYDQELLESFEKTREQLAEQDPEIAKFQLNDIGCVTVRRIIRLDGICKFAQAAQNPLIKAISYKPIPSSQ